MSTRRGIRRIAHLATGIAIITAAYAALKTWVLWGLDRGNEAGLHAPAYAAIAISLSCAVTAWILYGFSKPDQGC